MSEQIHFTMVNRSFSILNAELLKILLLVVGVFLSFSQRALFLNESIADPGNTPDAGIGLALTHAEKRGDVVEKPLVSSDRNLSQIPIVFPSPDGNFCNGDTIPSTVFGGSLPGTIYNWTSSLDLGFGTAGTDSIPQWIPTNPGNTPLTTTVIVIPSAAGCIGVADTFEYTVNPTPTVVPIPDQSYCGGDAASPIPLVSPVTGTTFGIECPDNGCSLLGAQIFNFDITIIPPNVSNWLLNRIIVTPSFNGCDGTADTFEITVRPKPTITRTFDIILCEGDIKNSPVGWTSDQPRTTFDWSVISGGAPFERNGTNSIPPFVATLPGIGADTTAVVVVPTADGCPGEPDTFLIITNPLPSITSQPANQTVCRNSTSATMQVVATEGVPTPAGDLNYQWQFSPDGGTTWYNVVTSAGGNSSTLIVQGAELANGNLFRVRVSEGPLSACGTTSSPAVVIVQQVDCNAFPWNGN